MAMEHVTKKTSQLLKVYVVLNFKVAKEKVDVIENYCKQISRCSPIHCFFLI